MPSKFKVGDVVVIKKTGESKIIEEVQQTQSGWKTRALYIMRRENKYDYYIPCFYSYELSKGKNLQYEEMM